MDNLAVATGSATASVAEALTKCPPTLHLHDVVEVERLGAAILLGEQEKMAKESVKTTNGDKRGVNVGSTYQGFWLPPESERAKTSDLAVIMYTSGSTGEFVNVYKLVVRSNVTYLGTFMFYLDKS